MHIVAGPGDFGPRWHWLHERVIIFKITYAAVVWWDGIDVASARSELERLHRAACSMITGAMRTTPTKVLEMFLDLLTLGMAVESVALIAPYHLPRPNPGNLGMGHNRIWAKADKMNKFNLTKDHITLRCTFGKHRTVILTREEWSKDWPNWLRKGQVWFTNGACYQQGTGTGVCKFQSRTHGTSHWDRMLHPFRQRLRQYWTV